MGWVIRAGRRLYGSLMTLKTIEKLSCHDPFRSSRSFISSPICHTFKSGAFASHVVQVFPRQPQVTLSSTSQKHFQASTLSSPTLKIAEDGCNRVAGWPWASLTGAQPHPPMWKSRNPSQARYSSSKHLCASRAVCISKYPTSSSPLQLIGMTLGVTPFY